jgi:hypothetical protein
MRQTVKQFVFLLILNLILVVQVKAQVYPVQINTQLIPPYSLRLSDYVAPGTNRIGLNMLLTDLNEPEYYIRLELVIEGNGITIKTKPTFNPGPIILEGGIPQYYTSSDLAEWFDPQNLDFSGYSRADYLATGRLPEGIYRFSFRAYDYNKGVRVSNNTMITAWLLLNDPPIINLPFPNHKVEHIDPQNIVFQWTPRHTGSPNSAFSTEYEFTLVEIWPEGRDPNNAIETSVPVFQTTTTTTTLVYGLSEPFLEPGRQYAYRIQARDVDERDMFKNNGYTEVRMFTFGDECKPVENLTAKSSMYNMAEITWTPSFTQTSFNVRYRKADDEEAEWFDEETFLDHLKINDLEGSTKYEYQVMGYCGTYEGDYSEVKTFTTPEPNIASFECGGTDESNGITNHDPLPSLKVGDYIWSGNFMFKISEVKGGSGTFTGKAFAMVPYLSFIKLMSEFENIKVNTDNQVYEGDITSVYNPNSPFVFGIGIGDGEDDGDGDGDGDGDNGGDIGSGDNNGNGDSEISDTITTTTIDSVYIDNDVIIIISEDGTTDTIPTTEDIEITDENGDTWTVTDGAVVTGGAGGAGGAGGGTGGTGGGGTDGSGTNDQSETVLAGIKFENAIFKNNDVIEIPYEYMGNILLTAVNSSGNMPDTAINWSFSDSTIASISYNPESIPLSGVDIIATIGDSKVIVKLTKATSAGVDEIAGELQIGPLSINLDSSRDRDKDGDYYNYTYEEVSFTLILGDVKLGEYKANISGAKLTYRENRSTDEIVQATIEWIAETPVDLGEVGIFKSVLTGVSLTVDPEGKLSGKVDLKTEITEDKNISSWVKLKKGLKADYSFEYEASESAFKGTFDFSKITGINIDLIKGTDNKVIAKLQNASINSDYILAGTVKQVADASFKQNNLTITVDDLTVKGEFDFKEKEFALKDGSGKLSVSGIQGTKGKVKIKVTYDGEDIVANVDADNFDLSMFGMNITPDKLNLKFNKDFEFEELTGSNVIATHDNIEGKIKIDKFLITKDELKELVLNGELSYKGIQFELKGCKYDPSAITWTEASAKVGENKISTYDFKIDSDGKVSCSSIKGDVSKGQMSASINVSVGENEFNGSFSGKVLKVGIDGTVIFGTSEKPTNDPSYSTSPMFSYGYFALKASSSSGVPIAPGLKLTKIGGMFGYNAWLTSYNPSNIKPDYKSYIAGLSLGISDAAGIIGLEVDPAIVQFGNDKLEIDITAAIKMPVSKPMFTATGNVKYEYPSNKISGYVQTSIKVPSTNGFVIKTVGANQINFNYETSHFKLESSQLHAKMFNSLDLIGYVMYEIKKDSDGNIILQKGALNAQLGFQYNKSWNGSKLGITYDAKFAILFAAGIETSFDEEGFDGTIYGKLAAQASGSVECTWFNYGATIFGSFEADGALRYIDKQASLYGKFEVELKYYNNNNPDSQKDFEFESEATVEF